jgi:hypothetical protein
LEGVLGTCRGEGGQLLELGIPLLHQNVALFVF